MELYLVEYKVTDEEKGHVVDAGYELVKASDLEFANMAVVEILERKWSAMYYDITTYAKETIIGK